MKIVTITLMRKGSKRFPGKNKALYNKKPLYMHTVDIALKLGYPYYLFTDYTCQDIKLPREKKEVFETRTRTKYFAGDIHRTCEEILSSGIEADIYILLQVTSPKRSIIKMKKWIKEFIGSNYAEAGAAVYTIPNGFYYDRYGKQINFNQEQRTDNGCHKDVIRKETGAFYIFKKHMLKEKHILDTRELMLFEDPYCIDIDEKKDLKNGN